MKNATEYRMIVLANPRPLDFPMVDFAQLVNGEWVSVSTGKTAKQLSKEVVAGLANYDLRPVKTATLAHGEQLLSAYYEAIGIGPRGARTTKKALIQPLRAA